MFVQPNKRRLDGACLYDVWHRNVWAAKQKSSGRPMFVQYLAPQCLCNQINAVWTDSVWLMFGRHKPTLKWLSSSTKVNAMFGSQGQGPQPCDCRITTIIVDSSLCKHYSL